MPEIPSLDYSSMDLEDEISEMIEIDRLELNTCMPAIVVKYDSATQTCSVQPCMKRTSVDGEVNSRAVIDDVHVVFPRSANAGLHFPVNEGDSVLLVFSQRSLDEWSDRGGQVELTDNRLHDITDAIAIVGLHPLDKPITPTPKEGATEVRGEEILLGKSGASDEPMVLGTTLQTNLEDLITAVEDLANLIAAPTKIVNPDTGFSEIDVSGVLNSLSSVASALPDQNSDFIFGEKS